MEEILGAMDTTIMAIIMVLITNLATISIIKTMGDAIISVMMETQMEDLEGMTIIMEDLKSMATIITKAIMDQTVMVVEGLMVMGMVEIILIMVAIGTTMAIMETMGIG